MRSRVVGVSPLATHRRRRPLVLMVRFLVLPRTGGPGRGCVETRLQSRRSRVMGRAMLSCLAVRVRRERDGRWETLTQAFTSRIAFIVLAMPSNLITRLRL